MKSYNSNTRFFAVGPFSDIEQRLEDFSLNIYFSFLLEENIQQQNAIEKEYQQALLDDDLKLAETKMNELKVYENIYTLSMAAYDPSEMAS